MGRALKAPFPEKRSANGTYPCTRACIINVYAMCTCIPIRVYVYTYTRTRTHVHACIRTALYKTCQSNMQTLLPSGTPTWREMQLPRVPAFLGSSKWGGMQKARRGENWVERRGALGSISQSPPPPHHATMRSQVCLLTMPGGLRRRPWGGGGGVVGTPTYIPQNDPDDALIILNTHKRSKIFVNKKIFHPSASGKNKQNWLHLGAHFLNPSPHHPGAPEPPPPFPHPQSKFVVALHHPSWGPPVRDE